MDVQQTIKRQISCAGIGLHSGQKVTLTLKPAPAELLCETAAELASHPVLGRSAAERELLEALWRTVEDCLEGRGPSAPRGSPA